MAAGKLLKSACASSELPNRVSWSISDRSRRSNCEVTGSCAWIPSGKPGCALRGCASAKVLVMGKCVCLNAVPSLTCLYHGKVWAVVAVEVSKGAAIDLTVGSFPVAFL